MAVSLRRKREALRGRYTPNLWPVWIVAPVALRAAGALGWVIYHYAYDHFAQAAAGQKPPKPVNINDPLKATVTALTLIGAVLAGLYAYRKQLLAEGDAHRADASQLADRYTTAAEQLGHDQAAVRLAGVYALSRLADDWAEQRQVCIDVLCAYLRIPYEPDPTAPEHKAGEQEVRQTIIRVIRDHLQKPDVPTAWCKYNFNFTGAVFDGGSLSTSHFRGTVTFADATFSGGTVTFADATFSGGTVDFHDATFSSGTVYFRHAEFGGGTVTFVGAEFGGGTVTFVGAEFGGGTVAFGDATFSGGTVDFHDATFSSGTVDFNGAEFSGGRVTFGGATSSSGRVTFGDATFSGGTVDFPGATFSGTSFDWGSLPLPTGA
ncbi:pentapeptide repeat-containing protein [Streptomyces sp. NPDC058142]|uniref:pentapeptide repeat-containing protein n=1 Tax=Streptomyces sp. NPDC058142 TaxID=3346355 RepID=UPI0036EDEB39